MKKLNLLNKYNFFLLLLCGFHLTVNLLWISLSTAPVPWDQAGHTRVAIQIADYFKSFGFIRIIDYFSISNFYPPFLHTIVAFFIIVFGHPVITSEIIVTSFFLASIIIVYKYFLELSRSRTTAILTATIYSFFPIIFEHSRWFLLEIPLLTFVLATLYFLKKSENLTRQKETFLSFLFLTFAFITKWTALVYLFLPMIFSFYNFLKLDKEVQARSKDFIVKGVTFFLVVASPWYLINLVAFGSKVPIYLQGEISDPTNVFTLRGLLFYLYLFVNFQITVYLAILFFIGLYYFIVSKNKNRFPVLVYISFFFLVFTLIPNKDWRHTIPILPFAAYIIVNFLMAVKRFNKALGISIIILVITLQVSYHSLLSFRNYFGLKYQRAIHVPVLGWIDYVNLNDSLARSYDDDVWPQKEILEFIDKENPNQDIIWVLCDVDQERFNGGNFLLQRDLSNLRRIEIENPPDSDFRSQEEVKTHLGKYNYAVITENKVIDPATRNFNSFLKLKEVILKDPESVRAREYFLPNGDKMYLYKLRSEQ